MNWPSVTLGEVAKFVRGITFKPDDVIPLATDGAVACLRTKNVQEDVDVSDVWGIPARFVRRPEQFLTFGDILVSTANSWNLVGKCSWIGDLPWPATIGGFISTLRASDRVDPRYLYYWFASERVQADVRKCARKTTNISNLSFDQCLALQIPLPPLPEQQRIAAILDQADALRRLRRDSLARLGDLGQAIFYEMFGDPISNPKCWRKVTLADCVRAPDDIRCGPFGTQLLKDEFQAEGVPLWGIKQVNKGFAIPTYEFVSERKAKELANYSIVSGDIVMTRKGTIGNCSVYPDGFPLGIMHSDLLRVRVDPLKCDPEFLSDQLHYSCDVQHQIALISGGAIMQGINVGKLKAIKVLCPPKPLQDEYMERVRAVGSRRREAIQHQAGMEKLFASLQHRAFRGEL